MHNVKGKESTWHSTYAKRQLARGTKKKYCPPAFNAKLLLHRSSFSHYSFCPLDKGELARGALSLQQSNSASSPGRPMTRLAACVKQRHRGWWSEPRQPWNHVSKSGYFCPRLIPHVALTSTITHPGLGRCNAQWERDSDTNKDVL